MSEPRNMCGKHEIMWFNGGPCPDCTAGLPALQNGFVHGIKRSLPKLPPSGDPDGARAFLNAVTSSNAYFYGLMRPDAEPLGLVDTLNPPLVVEADKPAEFACPQCKTPLNATDLPYGCWRCGRKDLP